MACTSEGCKDVTDDDMLPCISRTSGRWFGKRTVSRGVHMVLARNGWYIARGRPSAWRFPSFLSSIRIFPRFSASKHCPPTNKMKASTIPLIFAAAGLAVALPKPVETNVEARKAGDAHTDAGLYADWPEAKVKARDGGAAHTDS
ncbi:hypothetical protein TI39_contig523g00001, partial [Zymoseptoria brevis]